MEDDKASADGQSADAQLIQGCLEGDQDAWTALVDKYKNLIYSIPVRWGFSQDDATDVFQSVAAQLLTELRRLREPEALPAWLIQVTWRRCNQVKKERSRDRRLVEDDTLPAVQPPEESLESLIHTARRQQILRDVVGQSSPRCRQLIEMLFFESPARPYPEVAASLGIAIGSVGFIRRRCLDRLKASLEEAGFR